MMEKIKLLRYNTGNDKKVFLQFKDDFDAVIFNASIVAHSRNAIADLVSVHMNKYIVDPQTYILQHDISVIANSKGVLKESVRKYFEQLPSFLMESISFGKNQFSIDEIDAHLTELVEKVYDFQVSYINQVMKDKEYNKYLEFLDISPKPKLVIAPYFMLKAQYDSIERQKWIELNRKSLMQMMERSIDFSVATQLVLDTDVLKNLDVDEIVSAYNITGYDYIFIWINDFIPIKAKEEYQEKFVELIRKLNAIGKCPIMAYGGYDSIMLCHENSPVKLYGVAQSVGYGEARQITPVGGGLPVNKYYFYPLHQRLLFRDAAAILYEQGYFQKNKKVAAEEYHKYICDCSQCVEIIKNDINNFGLYNESIPFVTRNNIKRNRPTPDAALKADIHFMNSKVKEWESLGKKEFKSLVNEYRESFIKYLKETKEQSTWWNLICQEIE